MLMKLSAHCINDRKERLLAILQTVDIGEVIAEFKNHNELGPINEIITNTGVLIIQSPEDGKMITAYMITTDKAIAIYRKNGYANPPRSLMTTIKNNEKKRKFLFGL